MSGMLQKLQANNTHLRGYIPDDEKRSKVCSYLIGALLMIILSFAFYSVAIIDGTLFGTPEGEIDSII